MAATEEIRLFAGRSCHFLLQQLFLAIHQRIDVVRRQFKSMAVCDRIRRARFHTISAKNTSRIINVIDTRITLAGGNAVYISVFRSLNIDTIRRASRGTQKASHTFFQPALVAMEHVDAAIARLKMHLFVRIVLRDGLREHIAESHAEALHQGAKRLSHFANDRWHRIRSLTNAHPSGKCRASPRVNPHFPSPVRPPELRLASRPSQNSPANPSTLQ